MGDPWVVVRRSAEEAVVVGRRWWRTASAGQRSTLAEPIARLAAAVEELGGRGGPPRPQVPIVRSAFLRDCDGVTTVVRDRCEPLGRDAELWGAAARLAYAVSAARRGE